MAEVERFVKSIVTMPAFACSTFVLYASLFASAERWTTLLAGCCGAAAASDAAPPVAMTPAANTAVSRFFMTLLR